MYHFPYSLWFCFFVYQNIYCHYDQDNQAGNNGAIFGTDIELGKEVFDYLKKNKTNQCQDQAATSPARTSKSTSSSARTPTKSLLMPVI